MVVDVGQSSQIAHSLGYLSSTFLQICQVEISFFKFFVGSQGVFKSVFSLIGVIEGDMDTSQAMPSLGTVGMFTKEGPKVGGRFFGMSGLYGSVSIVVEGGGVVGVGIEGELVVTNSLLEVVHVIIFFSDIGVDTPQLPSILCSLLIVGDSFLAFPHGTVSHSKRIGYIGIVWILFAKLLDDM